MTFPRSFACVIAVTVFVGVFPALAPAASPLRKSPASKVFIANIEGVSEVNTGEKIERLTDKAVYFAQGATFFTQADGRGSMVFSNGTGIAITPLTQVEVRRFSQEPFVPNRSDTDIEPSISILQLYLSRGTLAICTSKLVAGSSMLCTTPHGTISLRGRKVHIETTELFTKVSLLEGDLTVRGGGEIDMGGQVLKPGQQALIPLPTVGVPTQMELREIPAEELKLMDERVTLACMARNTVYFDAAVSQTGEAVIQVIPTTPPELPISNTISNAVITTAPTGK